MAQTTENFTKARNEPHPSRRKKVNKREEAREPEGVFSRKLRDLAAKGRIRERNQWGWGGGKKTAPKKPSKN